MKNGGGVVFFNGFFGGLFTFTRRNMVLHISTKCQGKMPSQNVQYAGRGQKAQDGRRRQCSGKEPLIIVEKA